MKSGPPPYSTLPNSSNWVIYRLIILHHFFLHWSGFGLKFCQTLDGQFSLTTGWREASSLGKEDSKTEILIVFLALYYRNIKDNLPKHWFYVHVPVELLLTTEWWHRRTLVNCPTRQCAPWEQWIFCPPCNAFCALWSDCLSHSSHGNPDFKKCTKLFAFYPSHPFLQAAWHDCNSSMHTRGHFCNTQLSSWKPQGSCSSPAGPEDMCHNLVKTCLSRLIQEHVASMGGSELWGENVTRFPDVQCETSPLPTRKKWTC